MKKETSLNIDGLLCIDSICKKKFKDFNEIPPKKVWKKISQFIANDIRSFSFCILSTNNDNKQVNKYDIMIKFKSSEFNFKLSINT
ncbi:MAG: hypothetical protein K9J13_14860 [Saprospiraceae bacterium]|nr:hypothetical protein [Saprospiraceae bacterium]